MTPSVHLDLGQGPVVVLVHGVGAGPESLSRLVELLVEDHRVVVCERPLGPGGAALAVEDQADVLAKAIASAGAEGARLVGVSGGATVGLALAAGHPGLVAELVVHEPLVGPLAPALHQRFQRAATRAAAGPAEALAVVREVMGERAWEQLGPDGRDAARAQAPRWQAEVPAFAAFAPTTDQISQLAALPVLTTVGQRRGPERQEVAAVLVRLAGAEVREVPDGGNAVHLDAPDAFAHVLRAWQPAPIGGLS